MVVVDFGEPGTGTSFFFVGGCFLGETIVVGVPVGLCLMGGTFFFGVDGVDAVGVVTVDAAFIEGCFFLGETIGVVGGCFFIGGSFFLGDTNGEATLVFGGCFFLTCGFSPSPSPPAPLLDDTTPFFLITGVVGAFGTFFLIGGFFLDDCFLDSSSLLSSSPSMTSISSRSR